MHGSSAIRLHTVEVRPVPCIIAEGKIFVIILIKLMISSSSDSLSWQQMSLKNLWNQIWYQAFNPSTKPSEHKLYHVSCRSGDAPIARRRCIARETTLVFYSIICRQHHNDSFQSTHQILCCFKYADAGLWAICVLRWGHTPFAIPGKNVYSILISMIHSEACNQLP